MLRVDISCFVPYSKVMEIHPPLAFLFLATAGLICVGSPGFAGEEKSELDALPPVVQKTARKLVGKAKVEEVENTIENGKRAYEVEFERGGKKMAVVISTEGKLLQTEDRMSVGDTPENIRKALLKQYPHSEITHIKSIDVDGVVHFEVSVQDGGRSHALNLDKDGQVIKSGN